MIIILSTQTVILNLKILQLRKSLHGIPQSGKDLKAFFNTSGLIYREQQLKDKLPGLSEEEKLALLASNGMLVKRPILVLEDKVLVGFKEKNGWKLSICKKCICDF